MFATFDIYFYLSNLKYILKQFLRSAHILYPEHRKFSSFTFTFKYQISQRATKWRDKGLAIPAG